MKPINQEEIETIIVKRRPRGTGAREREIIDFLDSGCEMAELMSFTGKIRTEQPAYSSIVRRKGYPIKIISRNDKVYAITISAVLKYSDLPAVTNRKVYVEPWYTRLAFDVIGTEYAPPDDIEETMNYVISTLDGRKKQIIEQRYIGLKSLQEIGESLGLTRERVRQIELSAMRDMRKIPLRNYILIGIEKERKETEERKKISGIELKNTLEKDIANMPLDDLDLSVRAYNCIRRFTTVRTIGDLIKNRYEMGEDGFKEWLLTIQGLGERTAKHIVTCLDTCLDRAQKEIDTKEEQK